MPQPTRAAEPLPIGYVEFQTAWVGEKSFEERQAIVEELQAKIAQEAPGLVHHSTRVEYAPDGAGVMHFHMYVGMRPATEAAPPLDPRNLNNAPLPVIGAGPEPDALAMPIGYKEQQFNRGT